MSESESEQARRAAIREDVEIFLRQNFPQIKMHGGKSTVTDVDPDEGHVTIQLGGACNGCGLGPMTIQALQRRLPDAVGAVTSVSVHTGMEHGVTGSSPATGGIGRNTDDSETPDAPF